MARSILVNTLIRQLAIFINLVSKILILVIIGRLYGPEKFGVYSLVFVIYNYLYVFSGIGLKNYVFYQYSKEKHTKLHTDFNNVLSIISFISFFLIFFVLLVLLISGLGKEFLLFSLILNIGIIFDTLSEIFFHFLDSQERMVESSLLRMGANPISLIFISLTILILKFNFIFIFVGFLLSKILIFVLTIIKFKKTFDFKFRITTKPNFKKNFYLFKETIPFALNNFVTLGLNRIDILILSIVANKHAIGIYNSSLSLILRLNSIIRPFINAIFPRLNYYYHNNKIGFKNLFNNSSRIILTSGVYFFLVFFLGGEKIVIFFWGEKFYQSIPVIKILSLMIIFKFINALLVDVITISGNQLKRAKLIFYAFIFNLFLNIYLIPRFSYIGAAYSAVFTHILIFFGLIILLKRLKIKIDFDIFLTAKLVILVFLIIFFNRLIIHLDFFLYFVTLTTTFTLTCILFKIIHKNDFLKVLTFFNRQKKLS